MIRKVHISKWHGVITLLSSILLAFQFVTLSQAQQTSQIGWTPEDMMKVKNVDNVQVSPDGRYVVFTVTEISMTDEKSEYLTQIHLVNSDGSNERQITYGDIACTNPQWSPDGRWIAFVSSRPKLNNIWLLKSDGGEPQQLTDAKTDVGSYKWSPDSKKIAFLMVDPLTEAEVETQKGMDDIRVMGESLKMTRLYVIPIEPNTVSKQTARLLTMDEINVDDPFTGGIFDWSPDGKTIAFAHSPTSDWHDWPLTAISTVDVASGTIKQLVDNPNADTTPLYSPDGRWIAFINNTKKWEITCDAFIVPSDGGPARKLSETADRWPTLIGWSAGSDKIYFTELCRTFARLSALPINVGLQRNLEQTNIVMEGINLNASKTLVGFRSQSSTQPPEAYIADLNHFIPKQVSHVNAELPSYPLGHTDVIRWKASDGAEIEGLLTYPTRYEQGKRYPLLIIIHAGGNSFRAIFPANPFDPLLTGYYPPAVFSAHGYAILQCNQRGGGLVGYGLAYQNPSFKTKEKGYADLMAGIDYVIKMGIADEERLGIMGWSNGGLVTSWVISQSTRFKAAVVGAGVIDLISLSSVNPLPSIDLGGAFWDNLSPYLEHSPIFHVKGITTPTLILHGEKDDNVPIGQGYELYHTLKQLGVPVKMVTYPRSGHVPQNPKVILDIAKRHIEWFDHYLLPSPRVK